MKEAKVDFEKGLVDLFIDGKLIKTIDAWTFNAEKAMNEGWKLDYNYSK